MEINTDEEIRRRNKDTAGRNALFWIELANQRQSEIIRQLLGLSAVLLPLSASILLADIKINQTEKILLLHGWIFLLISIIAGFIQIFVDVDYFVKVSQDSSNREVLWSTNRTIRDIEKDVQKLGKVSSSSTDWPLRFQILTFSTGLVLIMVVAVFLLFDK